jgi:hypothetical protein
LTASKCADFFGDGREIFMKRWIFLLALIAPLVIVSGHGDNRLGAASAPQSTPTMSFFVSSAKSKTGNLGGLEGADRICQTLASAVGLGNNNWRAYLSVEHDPNNNNQPTDARSPIGNGPWFNANGTMVAKDLADLHARKGDASVFVDERGQRVSGNWPDSPKPTEHDILTGSTTGLCPGRPAATGLRKLPTCRRRWVTPTGSGPAVIRLADTPSGTRRMRMEAALTPLRGAVLDGFAF